MARRFEFRLQTLLRVRELREREAKRKVAAKSAEIARLDQLNAESQAEISGQLERLGAAQRSGVLDLTRLQRGHTWIAHLRRTIAVRSQQKAGLLEQLRELQDALREARTQTRIIEKLRERRWEAYRRDRSRAEQAELDEVARQLHALEQG
jgi:flagellar FliJ protein